FSSRRRHTISKRDWSSDVCSSDLAFLGGERGGIRAAAHDDKRNRQQSDCCCDWADQNVLRPFHACFGIGYTGPGLCFVSHGRQEERKSGGSGKRWDEAHSRTLDEE